MPAPTLTSITPNQGRALGDTYCTVRGLNFLPPVENPGAQTLVYFNGALATEIGVVSATEIRCLSPRGSPDASCVVTVANVVPNTPPAPPTTVAGLNSLPFTYKRPDLSSPNDLSNHPGLALITTKLVGDLSAYVVKDVFHNTHVDYADAADASVPQTQLSENPHIKITGPRVTEDPFYRQFAGERIEVPAGGDQVDVYDAPVPSQLRYAVTGVAKSTAQAGNLYEALARYMRATEGLRLVLGGVSHLFELKAIWDERADFKGMAQRHGVYQFGGAIMVRGVYLLSSTPQDKIGETRLFNGEVLVGITQKT